MPKENEHFHGVDFFYKYRDEKKFNDKKSVMECFKYFTLNNSDTIDKEDFERLLKHLFRFNGNSYNLAKGKLQKFFDQYKDEEVN